MKVLFLYLTHITTNCSVFHETHFVIQTTVNWTKITMTKHVLSMFMLLVLSFKTFIYYLIYNYDTSSVQRVPFCMKQLSKKVFFCKTGIYLLSIVLFTCYVILIYATFLLYVFIPLNDELFYIAFDIPTEYLAKFFNYGTTLAAFSPFLTGHTPFANTPWLLFIHTVLINFRWA